MTNAANGKYFVNIRRLETGSPTQMQPQSTLNDGWRKTTLSVPSNLVADDIMKDENGPIAPPRKKRLSLISPEQQPGFKELFGNNVSRRSSCDSILNGRSVQIDALQQKRMSDANVSLNASDAQKNVASETEMQVPLPLPESETSAAAAAAAATLPKKTEPRLQRIISRVGNKKSDKFFGENLSDCLSDEPVTTVAQSENVPTKDELDHFIDANNSAGAGVGASAQKIDSSMADDGGDEENKTSIDRKAEFLMAMLDDKNLYKDPDATEQEVIVPPKRRHSKSPQKDEDEPIFVAKQEIKVETEVKHDDPEVNKKLEIVDDTDYYKGMTPVDEPLIVPRRRQSKPHICDDDDHLHDRIHVQKSEKIEQPKVDEDREVSVADIVEQIITPKKPKRDFAVYEKNVEQSESTAAQSQPEVAKEKPIPRVRHLSHGNLLAPTRPSTTIDLSVTATAVDIVKQKSEADSPNQLDKTEQILKKCISQQSFLTEELMSKIVDRVYGFKDPIDDLDSYDDGSSKVSPHSKLTTRKISVARKDPAAVPPIHENPSEEKSNESLRVEIISAGPVAVIHTIESPSPPTVSTTQSTVKFLNLERIHSIVLEQSPEQPSTPANSIESIEATNDAINYTETNPSILTTSIIEMSITPTKHVLDDIYSSNRSILDGFQRYLDTAKKAPSIATTESSTIGSSDDENTDSDITITEMNANKNLNEIKVLNKIVKPNDGGERRDSIVEVDQWFLKHRDQMIGGDARRDSSSSIGYDTRKVFPFGKSEPGAGTEFFESQSNVDKNGNISSNNERNAQNDEHSVEHSTLLKYLK